MKTFTLQKYNLIINSKWHYGTGCLNWDFIITYDQFDQLKNEYITHLKKFLDQKLINDHSISINFSVVTYGDFQFANKQTFSTIYSDHDNEHILEDNYKFNNKVYTHKGSLAGLIEAELHRIKETMFFEK